MSSVESQLQALKECYTRVQTLRSLPQTLLTVPKQRESSITWLTPPPAKFEELKEIAETMRSERMQEALRAAERSEKADGNVGTNIRRKQRRRASPDSPRPYTESEGQKDTQEDVLRLEELVEYIRQFNKEHPYRLHIWRPTRTTREDEDAIVLRFWIKDVLTAYITSGQAEDGRLMVETIVVYGPREQVRSPHAESAYHVYRAISEVLAGQQMGVQRAVSMLRSYASVFTEPCVRCGRVMSRERHMPAVCRHWNGTTWVGKHSSCA